jgi:hypothetical protein
LKDGEPKKTLTINLRIVFCCVYFFVYGFYGAISYPLESNISNPNIFLLNVLIILSPLIFLIHTRNFFGAYLCVIHLKHLREAFQVFSLIVIFLFLFGLNELSWSLYSDELSYGSSAHIHAIKITDLVINRTDFFDSFYIRSLVQSVSILIISAFICTVYFLRSRSFFWIGSIFFISLIVSRILIQHLGGNLSPHPPLQYLPILLSGSVLGIESFGLKLGYTFSYIIYLLIFYFLLKRQLSPIGSFVSTLAFGSIPLLLHLSAVIEHSFWGSIFLTIVFLDLVTSSQRDYLRLFAVLSIGMMCRQTVIIGFLPVVLFLVYDFCKAADKTSLRKELYVSVPFCLAFLPFFAHSILAGTPSTSSINDPVVFDRLAEALNSGILVYSTLNSVPVWWIFFIIFLIVPVRAEFKIARNIFFASFVVSLVPFYSIAPSLWGLSKYQAEYFIPFVAVGLFVFMRTMSVSFDNRFGFPSFLFPLMFIAFNLVDYSSLSRSNKEVDSLISSLPQDSKQFDSGYRVLATFPYPFQDAYASVLKDDRAATTLSLGSTYGLLREINYGYRVDEYRSARDLYRDFTARTKNLSLDDSVKFLVGYSGVEVILIGDFYGSTRDLLLERFLENGWVVNQVFSNVEFGSSVVRLDRL